MGRVSLECRCLLIEEDDGRKVLLETGIGAFFEPKLAERYGVEDSNRHVLLENLSSFGVSSEDIDVVVLSHLHFDHAGGLLPTYDQIQKSGSRLVFPNAKFVVGSKALERSKNPHLRDRSSFVAEIARLLEDSGRLEIVNGKKSDALGSHYEFIYSSGHTPGQLHVLYRGGKTPVFFCGDLIPGTPWVHLPITMGYDRYPEKLIDEKMELMNLAIEEDWLLFYTHDVKYACSKLQKNEKGRFEPNAAIEALLGFYL